MRTVLIVGVPWALPELGLAAADAAALGARLCVVDTGQALARVDPSLGCELLPVPVLDEPSVVEAVGGRDFDGIVSITELTVLLAARVREALGHPGTPPEAEDSVMDKHRTRTVLRDAGLTGVGFRSLPAREVREYLKDVDLPVVVKPTSFTGSTGVRVIRGPEDVDEVLRLYDFDTIERTGRDEVIVETFVDGDEISVEGLVVEGELTVFALTDKLHTGDPTYYEIAHLLPSRFTGQWHERVCDYAQRVVTALGLVTSPIHMEVKLDGDRVELIETHNRYGGGGIVELLQESGITRPYRAYFEGVLAKRVPTVMPARGYWGVGHFVDRVEGYGPWTSFSIPHPEAVVRVDFDARRQPKVRAWEGLRLQYWYRGNVLSSAPSYDAVLANCAAVERTVHSRLATPPG